MSQQSEETSAGDQKVELVSETPGGVSRGLGGATQVGGAC